jgi:hypothetical protein
MKLFRNRFVGVVAGIGVVALMGSTWLSARSQGLGPGTAGSLAELTAEVRQLRLVVQEAGRNQTQIQALNISLTAQHSRLSQVSARLDKADEELRIASAKTQEVSRNLSAAQAGLARAPNDLERRTHQMLIEEIKPIVDKYAADENQIRTRQMELFNSFRAEEARWIELVAKLEEILKR